VIGLIVCLVFRVVSIAFAELTTGSSGSSRRHSWAPGRPRLGGGDVNRIMGWWDARLPRGSALRRFSRLHARRVPNVGVLLEARVTLTLVVGRQGGRGEADILSGTALGLHSGDAAGLQHGFMAGLGFVARLCGCREHAAEHADHGGSSSSARRGAVSRDRVLRGICLVGATAAIYLSQGRRHRPKTDDPP